MKVRQGFVSNSSSSSFVILSKGELDKKALRRAIAGEVPEDSSLLSKIGQGIVNLFYENAEPAEIESVEEKLSFLPGGTEVDNGKYDRFYVGALSNESGELESAIADEEFFYEDDDILIAKGGI
jgi:hypothetical protein